MKQKPSAMMQYLAALIQEGEPFDDNLHYALKTFGSSEEWKAMFSKKTGEYRKFLYRIYLLSNAWKQKRDAIFSRCGEVCERCRKRKAIQIHHITYANIGDELPEDLLAVCDLCHLDLHKKQSETPNDDKRATNGGLE